MLEWSLFVFDAVLLVPFTWIGKYYQYAEHVSKDRVCGNSICLCASVICLHCKALGTWSCWQCINPLHVGACQAKREGLRLWSNLMIYIIPVSISSDSHV